ncbi:carboxypeptidase regulatory-like domain-containing protein [Actinoplanes couchii]|uniref:carboxypeptidase regulatory-like domain-containing protein n=1 Tax=Actinoplanes couchii TaxID=403638 RepID=UPI001942B231|nr:carboxypeptidase regulatory-like domain-containing protein [Actinoplanes couchii]MDR6324198.1 hypothetical protein [Actinoplanes couchii]
MKIDSVAPSGTITPGSTVTVSFTVSNQRGEGDSGSADVETKVTVSGGGSCQTGCQASDSIDGGRSYNATIKAPNVGAGQKQQVTVTVNANNGENGSASASFTVEGAAAPPVSTNVRLVSGRVKDDSGDRVSGVKVVMKDSAGAQYTTSTNGDGGFSFTSSDSQPISAGTIRVAAAKEGYDAASASVQGAVGKTVTVPLTMKKVVAPSPSASPSASASASAEATEDPAEEETTEEENAGVDLGQNTNEAANTSEDSGSNWLLIIMGVLLVAAGLGAMLLVWMRRKKAEELAAETGVGKIPPATGGGGNSFDQTRVAAPVGAGGRGGDATMIAPAAGMGGGSGSLADAPTMIHRQPVEDEFPDPYGAPLPANGGFNGQQNNQQWGNEPAGDNYGGGTQPYGQQQGGYDQGGYDQGGYGQQGGYDQGGYGQQQQQGGWDQGGYDQHQQQGGGGYGGGQTQRYDEHTNMYQPEQPQVPQQQQRYDEATGMYQPQQQGGGYDQGGYDQQGGYGQQQQGGWDNGQQQQQQGGYGQQPQQGGWDDDQQGYDQRGNAYGNNGQNRNWNG